MNGIIDFFHRLLLLAVVLTVLGLCLSGLFVMIYCFAMWTIDVPSMAEWSVAARALFSIIYLVFAAPITLDLLGD